MLALLVTLAVLTQPLTLREDNIDEVLAAMTLKEKATLVTGAGYKSMLAGMLGANVPVPGAAGMTQGIPRLGIPPVILSDGPAGVRIEPRRRHTDSTFYCTGFPIGSSLASTWNLDLVGQVGRAIGEEALAYGVDVLLAPGMNLQRNPLCGRNFEYFSEDPLLSGRTAAAYIRGVQGTGVGTSAKHFAANNQETNRFGNDSRVDTAVLRSLYLRGFEIAVREARPWTVMASYNRLNGVHTQQDRWLLTDVLRGEWGFDGLVMTDWTGKRDTPAQIAAGCDLMEPGTASQTRELIRAVRRGELSEAALDTCVRRVLELVVKTPTFKGLPRSQAPDLAAHALIARQAAEEGIVLLENKFGVLPLECGSTVALFGVGSYQTLPGGTGSGNVHRPYVVNLSEGLVAEGFSLDSSLADIYAEYLASHKPRKTMLSGMLGSPAVAETGISHSAIESSAQSSDVAIVTLSRQAGEGGDRHLEDDFLISTLERQLITDVCETFHSAGKRVVVVLNVGGVIETASWKDLPDAVLLAWQAGQEAGAALASLLGGRTCPSARLPVTFPADYFDLPSSANFPYDYHGRSTMTGGRDRDKDVPGVGYTDYTEGLSVGYRAYLPSASPSASSSVSSGISAPAGSSGSSASSGISAPAGPSDSPASSGSSGISAPAGSSGSSGSSGISAPAGSSGSSGSSGISAPAGSSSSSGISAPAASSGSSASLGIYAPAGSSGSSTSLGISAPAAPSYPFGYGLSYTTFSETAPVFSYDQPRSHVSDSISSAIPCGTVSVTVTNTGSVAGKHVVLVMNPVLCAFGKTRLLSPGESETLTMPLYPF